MNGARRLGNGVDTLAAVDENVVRNEGRYRLRAVTDRNVREPEKS